jgi:hypothetical protein
MIICIPCCICKERENLTKFKKLSSQISSSSSRFSAKLVLKLYKCCLSVVSVFFLCVQQDHIHGLLISTVNILPWHFICTFRGTMPNYSTYFLFGELSKPFAELFPNFRDSSHAKKNYIFVFAIHELARKFAWIAKIN